MGQRPHWPCCSATHADSRAQAPTHRWSPPGCRRRRPRHRQYRLRCLRDLHSARCWLAVWPHGGSPPTCPDTRHRICGRRTSPPDASGPARHPPAPCTSGGELVHAHDRCLVGWRASGHLALPSAGSPLLTTGDGLGHRTPGDRRLCGLLPWRRTHPAHRASVLPHGVRRRRCGRPLAARSGTRVAQLSAAADGIRVRRLRDVDRRIRCHRGGDPRDHRWRARPGRRAREHEPPGRGGIRSSHRGRSDR